MPLKTKNIENWAIYNRRTGSLQSEWHLKSKERGMLAKGNGLVEIAEGKILRKTSRTFCSTFEENYMHLSQFSHLASITLGTPKAIKDKLVHIRIRNTYCNP